MTSSDRKTWMWAEACALLEQAERLHRQFFQPSPSSARQLTWEPPADMFETERELAILVALPGVAPTNIKVGLDAGSLVVVGERPLPKNLRRALIHRLEIPYGRFERRIELPPGRFEYDGQEIADGCLLIRLRKLT